MMTTEMDRRSIKAAGRARTARTQAIVCFRVCFMFLSFFSFLYRHFLCPPISVLRNARPCASRVPAHLGSGFSRPCVSLCSCMPHAMTSIALHAGAQQTVWRDCS
jgi:hypothetical protein